MDFFRTLTGQRPPVTSVGADESEEVLAEIDEPPEDQSADIPTALPIYTKAAPPPIAERRESLLTRQLHSETDQTDEEMPHPPRALSTQSTWSTYSTTSTAELTSDDGRSVTSPAISPPLPPTSMRTTPPVPEKPWTENVRIVGQESSIEGKGAGPTTAVTSIEANLGRKRCISFACGGKAKEQAKPASPPPSREAAPASQDPPASPPKRKCTLKFVCPSKTDAASKVVSPTAAKRVASPPPPPRRSTAESRQEPVKVHRGSDSTVTHASPRSVRRVPLVTTTSSTTDKVPNLRKLDDDSDESGTEATRFHVFGASEEEPEEWVQESTCHRSRLTIRDTLNKENVIRQACEEVEEEVMEEEGEDEDDVGDGEGDVVDHADADDDDDDDNDDDDEDIDHDGMSDDEESVGSDDGFHSDDEEGFAASDSEGDGSDNEWWRPGGHSTAATSVEHIDRMSIQRLDDAMPTSSVGSISSAQASPRAPRHHRFHHRNARKARHAGAVDIPEPDTPHLPDSTDFVCGTLDEDRPLEQAYLHCIKTREAAKHKLRPQDIDPTFPTSDPEMDEEDDEDLEGPEQSERDGLVHGDMDDVDEVEDQTPIRRRPSIAAKRRSTARSPPPPPRPHSPAPKRRVHPSPPPLKKRGTEIASPPPKLFGKSPARRRSPAPRRKTTTPPRASPPGFPLINAVGPFCLAQRTHLTHTASLPRAPGLFLSRMHGPDENDGDDTGATEAPKRGAIDIVKGLERKRQRRKEKLYQKACAKAAAKNEKAFRVKPGRGAERMRELGLELQRYHGKGEFILSA
nr:uncharacterized protein CFP56_09187 [Quercus suber]